MKIKLNKDEIEDLCEAIETEIEINYHIGGYVYNEKNKKLIILKKKLNKEI